MGSFNLQCAITRETIGEDDEIVSFFVEPVLNEDGNVNIYQHLDNKQPQYVISSLPVYGRYGDYGRAERLKPNEEPLGNQLAVDASIALYDYDYTEAATEDYPGHFAKGGGKGYFDTNTQHIVIKKESYDAIWSEVKDKDLADLLDKGKIKEAFSGKIDPDFLAYLQDLKDVNPIEFVGAAQIVRAFDELNVHMGLNIKIASQFSGNDFRLRKLMHMGLKDNKPNPNAGENEQCKYTCMVSGDAFSAGDKVMAIPIVGKHTVDGEKNIAIINDHEVCGLYQLTSSPIKCTVNNDGTINSSDITDEQARLMRVGLPISYFNDKDAQDSVNTILINRPSIKNWGNYHQLTMALISERAYNALQIQPNKTLKTDFNIFKKSAKIFDEFISQVPIDQIKARQILEKSGLYDNEDLEVFYDYLVEDLTSTTRDPKYRNRDIGRGFKNSFCVLKSSTGEGKYDRNEFTDLIRHDSEQSFLSKILRTNLSNIITDNETGNLTDIANRLSGIVNVLKDSIGIISYLDKNGLGLIPAKEYTGTLTVQQQRILNQSVREPSTKAVMEKLKDYDDEMSL